MQTHVDTVQSMEQWEHMALTLENLPRSKEILAIRPNRASELVDTENLTTRRVLEQLDELGQDGWQLVATDHIPSSEGEARTFWLKRRRPEGETGGGWGTGI